MLQSLVPVVLIGALASAASARAPLCRDMKGLYTPCPPGVTPQPIAPTRISPAIAAAAARPSPVMQANYSATPFADATRMRAPTPVIARAMNLCRDMKGSYTPCQ